MATNLASTILPMKGSSKLECVTFVKTMPLFKQKYRPYHPEIPYFMNISLTLTMLSFVRIVDEKQSKASTYNPQNAGKEIDLMDYVGRSFRINRLVMATIRMYSQQCCVTTL